MDDFKKRATKAFIDRWNRENPDGPRLVETETGFTTAPYCKKMPEGYTLHVGHRPDDPCLPDE